MKLTKAEMRMVLLVLRTVATGDGCLYRSEARRRVWLALADKIDAALKPVEDPGPAPLVGSATREGDDHA